MQRAKKTAKKAEANTYRRIMRPSLDELREEMVSMYVILPNWNHKCVQAYWKSYLKMRHWTTCEFLKALVK